MRFTCISSPPSPVFNRSMIICLDCGSQKQKTSYSRSDHSSRPRYCEIFISVGTGAFSHLWPELARSFSRLYFFFRNRPLFHAASTPLADPAFIVINRRRECRTWPRGRNFEDWLPRARNEGLVSFFTDDVSLRAAVWLIWPVTLALFQTRYKPVLR